MTHVVTVEFTVAAEDEEKAVVEVRAALRAVEAMLHTPETPNALCHLTDYTVRRVD